MSHTVQPIVKLESIYHNTKRLHLGYLSELGATPQRISKLNQSVQIKFWATLGFWGFTERSLFLKTELCPYQGSGHSWCLQRDIIVIGQLFFLAFPPPTFVRTHTHAQTNTTTPDNCEADNCYVTMERLTMQLPSCKPAFDQHHGEQPKRQIYQRYPAPDSNHHSLISPTTNHLSEILIYYSELTIECLPCYAGNSK